MAAKPIPEGYHTIGDSVVMLSDPIPQAAYKSPKELGGTSVGVFLYVEDVDAVVEQAVDAGAERAKEAMASMS